MELYIKQETIQNNVVFSKEKFCVSPKVVFAGLELCTSPTGKVSILPDKKRIEALLNLAPPTNKKELQSVMGLLSTFQKWIPSLSMEDAPIRQLSKKSTHFLQNNKHALRELRKPWQRKYLSILLFRTMNPILFATPPQLAWDS